MLGSSQANRANAVGNFPSYLPDADPGMQGGGTYTASNTEPTLQDYENIFGPSARDIKQDLQRFKRHGRWHLPDILKGPNPWLTDRIDGLITDATNSPFTTKLLPYLYKDNVDGKIKWNVWSFDEGMASRVPYESAARTLQQSKRSFSGYMVRQGMAIVLEHNFMMTPKGRENFKNQLNQLIGSIQYTNDLDVHMALILAPSYQKTMREKYFTIDKSSAQICREFVDLFGMMQKNTNALDILIEEAKAILKTWGGPEPDFMLCNSKLTFQLTMNPEKTNYMTQGIDGVKRLRQGPDLASYRGLSIVHSRAFAMEVGQHPRDVLRRRVRTAEYYRIPPRKENLYLEFEFYNEERDTWFTLSFKDLLRYARYDENQFSVPDDAKTNRHQIYREYAAIEASAKKNGGDVINMMARLEAPPAVVPALGARVFVVPRTELGHFGRIKDDILTNRFRNPFRHYEWNIVYFPYDLGVKHIEPVNWEPWTNWVKDRKLPVLRDTFGGSFLQTSLKITPWPLKRLNSKMVSKLYDDMSLVPLNNILGLKELDGSLLDTLRPNTPAWNVTYSYLLSIYQRNGIPLDCLNNTLGAPDAAAPAVAADPATGLGGSPAVPGPDPDQIMTYLRNIELKIPVPRPTQVDISRQVLGMTQGISPNHPIFLRPPDAFDFKGLIRRPAGVASDLDFWNESADTTARARGYQFARMLLIPSELSEIIFGNVTTEGKILKGLDVLQMCVNSFEISATLWGAGDDITPLEFPAGPNFSLFSLSRHFAMKIKKNLLDAFEENSIFLSEDNSDFVVRDTLRNGVELVPLGLTTESSIYKVSRQSADLLSIHGGLTYPCLNDIGEELTRLNHPWRKPFRRVNECNPIGYVNLFRRAPPNRVPLADFNKGFLQCIIDRCSMTPDEYLTVKRGIASQQDRHNLLMLFSGYRNEDRDVLLAGSRVDDLGRGEFHYLPSNRLEGVTINMNNLTGEDPYPPKVLTNTKTKELASRVEDVEIVIIRPNIEHNMLGIIMGLGGNELGNTLWGQTELSVYDDSMHGIWGMSYKYHERAIVFNEKNLIRLWDIAYDGYNGGKDDTYVNWNVRDGLNGLETFKEATLDVSRSYRGPSMMVMAFVHDKGAKDTMGDSVYEKHFRRNWPSPIVFHDKGDGPARGERARMMLPVDTENLHVVDVEEFRVFNNPLYKDSYTDYYTMMPNFQEMHQVRKTAGQSSAEAETPGDCLAFQGSMRVKKDSRVVEEVQGSGHHGPDYIGVASVRAGKGQKVASGAPTIHRLV